MNFLLPALALSILYTHYIVQPETVKWSGSNAKNLIQAQVLGVQDLSEIESTVTPTKIETLNCLDVSPGYGFKVVDYTPGLDSEGEDLPVSKKRLINALQAPLVSKEDSVYLGMQGSITLQFARRFTSLPDQADIFINKTDYEVAGSCYLHEPRARVAVSQDNTNWVDVGMTCTKGQLEFPQSIEWAQYLRIIDQTVTEALPDLSLGFPVKGVKALLCLP